jgi:hypothetical protein
MSIRRRKTRESKPTEPSAPVEHPEVHRLREFLKVTKEIYRSARLSEEIEDADALASQANQLNHLNELFRHLGIDPDPESAWHQLGEMEYALTERETSPQPVIDVPGAAFFTARVQEIIQDPQAPYLPLARAAGRVSLEEVVMYGHTDWSRVGPRGKSSIGEYIHDVARVMADPVCYQLHFARTDFDLQGTNDHAAVAEDWRITNGRHRSLAARALGAEFVAEVGMNQWVHVAVTE